MEKTVKMTYGEQLKHPNWQRRRLERLALAEWQCECCYGSDITLHVHHKRYVKGRMAWEYSDTELAVLCEDCHVDAHANIDTLMAVVAHLPVDGPRTLPEATALLVGWASDQCGTPNLSEFAQGPTVWVGEAAGALEILALQHLDALPGLLITNIDFATRLRALIAEFSAPVPTPTPAIAPEKDQQ